MVFGKPARRCTDLRNLGKTNDPIRPATRRERQTRSPLNPATGIEEETLRQFRASPMRTVIVDAAWDTSGGDVYDPWAKLTQPPASWWNYNIPSDSGTAPFTMDPVAQCAKRSVNALRRHRLPTRLQHREPLRRIKYGNRPGRTPDRSDNCENPGPVRTTNNRPASELNAEARALARAYRSTRMIRPG